MDCKVYGNCSRGAAMVLLLLFPASAGLAQTANPELGQGPLVLELVHNPFVVAPDYKVTDIDGEFGQLAGGYVGRVIEDALFVGGAGYWLVNGSDGDELAYGGLLTGWSVPLGNRVRFGARSLIGGGRATLGTDVDVRRGAGGFIRRGIDPHGLTRFGINTRGGAARAPLTAFRVRARDDFFVFEPQADLLTRVTDHVSVNWAAGYRLTALTDVLDDRLNGATGSLALQLEW